MAPLVTLEAMRKDEDATRHDVDATVTAEI